MLKRHKDLLRAIVASLRLTLAGAPAADGQRLPAAIGLRNGEGAGPGSERLCVAAALRAGQCRRLAIQRAGICSAATRGDGDGGPLPAGVLGTGGAALPGTGTASAVAQHLLLTGTVHRLAQGARRR